MIRCVLLMTHMSLSFNIPQGPFSRQKITPMLLERSPGERQEICISLSPQIYPQAEVKQLKHWNVSSPTDVKEKKEKKEKLEIPRLFLCCTWSKITHQHLDFLFLILNYTGRAQLCDVLLSWGWGQHGDHDISVSSAHFCHCKLMQF